MENEFLRPSAQQSLNSLDTERLDAAWGTLQATNGSPKSARTHGHGAGAGPASPCCPEAAEHDAAA